MENRQAMHVQAQLAVNKPEPASIHKPIAIFVCHGMGEQVPFQSIDAVATILRKHIEETAAADGQLAPNAGPPAVDTRIVEMGEQRLARAELQVPVDGVPRTVHVYETYWAPITAGKVSISEVFRFLIEAGKSGFDKSWNTFNRYMFGAAQEFEPNPSQAIIFVLLIAVLTALGVMSATAISVGAARVLTQKASGWPGDGLMTDLSCDFLAYFIVAGTLALLYLWAWLRYRRRKERAADAAEEWLNLLIGGWLVVTLIATLLTGAAVTVHLFLHYSSVRGPTWPAWPASLFAGDGMGSGAAVALVWAAILYLNNKARRFLVDYLGDVLAYIAPHTANKFCQTRWEIQKRAQDAAKAIYDHQDEDGDPVYQRIILAGHSLGSVVAYDTLNAVLLDEDLGRSRQARARTSHLITFGSPLDKTAFIFREQQHESYVREALAANMQPLILHDRHRERLHWINIWSRQDPISGALDYYDRPGNNRVRNLEDTHSNIPLFAHTMYWQSPVLRAALAEAVRGAVARPEAASGIRPAGLHVPRA